MIRGGWLTLLAVLLSLSGFIVLVGCGGTASSSNPPAPTNLAPTIQFSADKTSIIVGQTVVLTWNSSNATGVTIQPGGPAGLGPAGTLSVTPSATTTYTATATGAGGTATATMTITVTPPAPPTVTLTASPATVNAGELSTLAWTSTGANSVVLDPKLSTEDNQALAVSGQAAVAPRITTTYTITATGPGGTATATTTVTVNQPAPTITLTVNPTSTVTGTPATLAWTSQNATSVSIDNGIGAVPAPSGNKSVTPNATTTYTATATGLGGTAKASVTLTVQQFGVTLTATPTTVGNGQSTTLAWTSQAATSVRIDPEPGAVNSLNGSALVKPTATTTYTATATDAAGNTKTAQATVVVLPSGAFTTSIKHIIFFIQENRSFDHYFGKLGEYRVSQGLPNDVDGLPLNAVQKDQNGVSVHSYHQQTTCAENTSPSWNPSWGAYNLQNFTLQPGPGTGGMVLVGGTPGMDGFVRVKDQPSTIDPQYHRAMAFYDQTDLPYYYELATQFATSDRWFEPVMAGTIPNRMYFFAGTSFGHVFPDPQPVGGWLPKTIFELMTEHNVSWRYYFQDNSVFLAQWNAWNNPAIRSNVVNISEYYKILADPNADALLPSVIFIEHASETQDPATGLSCSGAPSATCTSLDEHPDSHTQAGAARSAQIINALLDSAAWKSSVFILTYDEFGGLFDHVPILSAPAPDNVAPIQSPGFETLLPGDFQHTGFRIPVIVISPWVKPSHVSHTPTDGTAILKLIETRFALPPLTPRDAAASDMLDFFDFSTPTRLNAPNGQPWTKFLPTQPTDKVCDFKLEIVGQQ